MEIAPRSLLGQKVDSMKITSKRIADAEIYNNDSFYDVPKEYYRLVLSTIQAKHKNPDSLLDIGCANGSFIHHAQKLLTETSFFGAEPVPELAEIAQRNTDAAIFTHGLFDIAEGTKYQVVTMLGVLGIFADVDQVLRKIKSLMKPSGMAIIFSPFNEEDIDVILSYRRAPCGPWESGHNLFSKRTVENTGIALDMCCEWIEFEMSEPIPKTSDPMRSWTEPFRNTKNHLIYGTNMFSTMKLLILK